MPTSTDSRRSDLGQVRRPGQGILANQVAPGLNIADGASAFPIAGQQVIRGWLLLACALLATVAVVSAFVLVIKVADRKANIVPGIVKSGDLNGEVSDMDIASFSVRFTALAENWSYENVANVPDVLRERLDPSLYQTFDETYKGIREKSGFDRRSQSAVPQAWVIGGRTNGVFACVVKYDLTSMVETNGRRETAYDRDRIAFIRMASAPRNKDNPDGLRVLSYLTDDTSAWLKNGQPKFWKD